MKRSFSIGLIVALSLLIVLPASSQIIGIGAKGGLNFSNLRGDFVFVDEGIRLDADLNTKTGFVIGASFRSRLMPFISLQPEILYSEKGAKYGEGGFEGTIDLAYLEVPLLLRVGLPVPGFSPFAYAGPSFAYNLKAEVAYEFSIMGQRVSGTDDFKDEVKNLDVGLVIGGGLEFGLPLLKLHVEGRYTMGLGNIYDGDDVNGDIDLKNGVFSLMVGVTL